MLRLVRMLVLVMIAFVGGIFFERIHQQNQCETSGGEWMRAGVCAVTP